jgi:hypothetical protein
MSICISIPLVENLFRVYVDNVIHGEPASEPGFKVNADTILCLTFYRLDNLKFMSELRMIGFTTIVTRVRNGITLQVYPLADA